MPSLVLTSDCLSVRLESRRFDILRRNPLAPDDPPVRTQVPLHDLDRVVVVGQPAVTMPVLAELMDNGIPCFFLTAKGRWRGAIGPDRNLNGARRVRQYEMATDPVFCLKVARRLVEAKLRNSRRVLQRLAANRELSDTDEHESICNELKHLVQRAGGAGTADELRGIEGLAAARYFRRVAQFFPKEIPFRERSRRPPRDAANALLSWTYTILLGEVEGAVRAHGLDAALGVLHADALNAPSLALDLVEPLRPAVADLLVLSILNHSILKPEHFEVHSDDGGTYLTEAARKPFFVAYEQAMTRRFSPAKGEPHTDLRRVIDDQVCTYLDALERGQTDEVLFFHLP
jgi:CRISPR-associated protein Cas1